MAPPEKVHQDKKKKKATGTLETMFAYDEDGLEERIKQLQRQNMALLAEAKRRAAAEIAESVQALIT